MVQKRSRRLLAGTLSELWRNRALALSSRRERCRQVRGCQRRVAPLASGGNQSSPGGSCHTLSLAQVVGEGDDVIVEGDKRTAGTLPFSRKASLFYRSVFSQLRFSRCS